MYPKGSLWYKFIALTFALVLILPILAACGKGMEKTYVPTPVPTATSNPTSKSLVTQKSTTPKSQESTTLSIGVSSGVSISITEIQRGKSSTLIQFLLNKVASISPGKVPVTLIDDHDNSYTGALDILSDDSNGSIANLLPMGYVWTIAAKIDIPEAAPIKAIRLGDAAEVAFQDVLYAQPNFMHDYPTSKVLKLQQGFSVGQYLQIKVGAPVGTPVGWALPIMISNSEYNPVNVDVKLGIDFDNCVLIINKRSTRTDIPQSDGTMVSVPMPSMLGVISNRASPTTILISVAASQGGKELGNAGKLIPVVPENFGVIPDRIVFEQTDPSIILPNSQYELGGIWTMNIDGSGQSKIAPGINPSWSPDGTRLAFITRISGDDRPSLCVIDADDPGNTSQVVVMRNCIKYWPMSYPPPPAKMIKWSPDGSRIAVQSDSSEITVVSVDGSGKPIVIKGYDPSWAPDSTRLAYCIRREYMDSDIYMLNVDASEAATYLGPGTIPEWSPDGTCIAYKLWKGYSGYSLMVMDADGSNARTLSLGDCSLDTLQKIAWSPAADKLAITLDGSGIDTRSGIPVIYNMKDSTKTILDENGVAGILSWSPDGTKILFDLADWTSRKIYITNVDRSGKRELGQGTNPIWAPALKLTENGVVPLGIAQPEIGASATATIEVANMGWSELSELGIITGEVLAQANLVANEEQKGMLNQTDLVLASIKPGCEIQNLVAEKSEKERLILDALEMTFAEGLRYWAKVFYNVEIPSLIGGTVAKGAEQLGNLIAEWVWLGDISFARMTLPNKGSLDVVYDQRPGEIWATFNVNAPPGQICMYIPVEPNIISPPGSGNVILTQGVRPVMDKVRIAYRLGAPSQ